MFDLMDAFHGDGCIALLLKQTSHNLWNNHRTWPNSKKSQSQLIISLGIVSKFTFHLLVCLHCCYVSVDFSICTLYYSSICITQSTWLNAFYITHLPIYWWIDTERYFPWKLNYKIKIDTWMVCHLIRNIDAVYCTVFQRNSQTFHQIVQ